MISTASVHSSYSYKCLDCLEDNSVSLGKEEGVCYNCGKTDKLSWKHVQPHPEISKAHVKYKNDISRNKSKLPESVMILAAYSMFESIEKAVNG